MQVMNDRAAGAPRPTESRPGHLWLSRPEWPLAVIFVGYPLWWLLGISQMVALAMTVPMAAYLLRRRMLWIPHGFGWWFGYLAVAFLSVTMLGVHAAYTVDDHGSSAYLSWAFRMSWYLMITVSALYVVNQPGLSTVRVARIVGWLFVWVVIGGLASLVAPTFEFATPMERLLPGGLADIAFVRDMIHANLAQVQTVLGYQSPRPSAPFTYTNDWGLNFALLLGFFVVGWLSRPGWQRRVASVILAASLVPVVYSSNRALWLALCAMAVVAAIKLARQGHLGPMVTMLVAMTAAVCLVMVSPLGTQVGARLSGEAHNSDAGRSSLAAKTLEAVADGSPVIGFGGTREVSGNFTSFADGASSWCPKCSPPSFGTQGVLWLALFSGGLLGLALFLAFFVRMLAVSINMPGAAGTLAALSLVGFTVVMAFYDALGIAMAELMIAVGLMCRDRGPLHMRLWEPHRTAVRKVACVVGAGALVGGILGLGWSRLEPGPVTASVSVLVPNDSALIRASQGLLNMDTVGVISRSDPIQDAARSAGAEATVETSAEPNTRIVVFRAMSSERGNAAAAVTAAAGAFTAEIDSLLALRSRAATLHAQTRVAEDSTRATVAGGKVAQLRERRPSATTSARLALARADYWRAQQDLTTDLAALLGVDSTTNALIPVQDLTMWRSTDERVVRVMSGVTLGAGAATIWYLAANARRDRRTFRTPVHSRQRQPQEAS
ncbi:MAG: O-antigen ligase family protein [Nocardioides sp.]